MQHDGFSHIQDLSLVEGSHSYCSQGGLTAVSMLSSALNRTWEMVGKILNLSYFQDTEIACSNLIDNLEIS